MRNSARFAPGALASALALAAGWLAVGGLALSPASVAAQGTGRSMDIDASAISAGMGGASSAVFWSAEPNYWANPALLGYYRGVRWQWSRAQLVPGLPADVSFSTKRFTFASFGLGAQIAGRPVSGVGGLKLDYGESEGTDPAGNPTGTFGTFEDIRAWGGGLSLSQLATSTALVLGHELPAVTKYFDLAGGWSEKRVKIVLGPGPSGVASGTTRDKGMLARYGLGTDVFGLDALPLLRVDASYAEAILNYNDALFTFENSGASPPTRMKRVGHAQRIAIGLPPRMAREAGSPIVAALLRGFDPLVSFGDARDDEHVSAGAVSPRYDVRHRGNEITVLNVFSLRHGHITDVLEDIDGDTSGFGIGLPIGDVAGVRYDQGKTPQSRNSGLGDVTHHSFSMFIDALALRRAMR